MTSRDLLFPALIVTYIFFLVAPLQAPEPEPRPQPCITCEP